MSSKARTYTLDEVYGISRELPENYVVRDRVDARFVGALARNQHIVIFGSSKQGKTCLRKYNLKESDFISVTCSNKWNLTQLHSSILKSAGYTVEGTTTRTVSGQTKVSAKMAGGIRGLLLNASAEAAGEVADQRDTTESETPMELDPEDVNDIIAALKYARAPKFIVLEDFHYLPENTQRDFAVTLKAFHEASDLTFIIVGVWLDENRIIQHNGDLAGRVISVNADVWEPAELREVIQEGQKLLNVEFESNFVESLIENAFDSVWVVQEVCRQACEDANVYETQPHSKLVQGDAAVLISGAVASQSGRYHGFLINFSLGFRETQLKMYRWILYAVLSTDVDKLERGVSLGEIQGLINARHPEAPLNAASFTQSLQAVSSLQVSQLQIKPIILDYDQTYQRLNVVDRSFLIWMQHQQKEELLDSIELPAG